MSKTLNLPRSVAEKWSIPIQKNTIWISIGEPEIGFQHIENPILGNLPNLKISFQDFTRIEDVEEGDIPPTIDHADGIIDFVLKHKDCDIIVNCAMGVSRSGAVCKFLEDYLDYNWLLLGKKHSNPNRLLYSLLKDSYIKKQYE